MGISKKINVFNLDFKNIKALTDLLGYKAPQSLNRIAFKYGTLENMVKIRLRVNTDEQARSKLLELLEQKDQPKDKETAMQPQPKELSELSNEQQCAKKYAQALLNKGDEQILNSLLLAFGCENEQGRESVLKYFDEIKKGV